MYMLNNKFPLTIIGQQEDKMIENKRCRVEQDMIVGSEFVDLGGFLENSSLLDKEII